MKNGDAPPPVPPLATATGIPLDQRVAKLEADFASFQARIELVVSLLKWCGGFVVTTLVVVVIQLISVSYSAGRLQEKVDSQTAAVGKLQEKVDNQTVAIAELKTEIKALRADFDKRRGP